jgi:hypothetical protein
MTEQRQSDKDEIDEINPDGADLDGTAEIERQGAAGATQSAKARPSSSQSPQKSGGSSGRTW